MESEYKKTIEILIKEKDETIKKLNENNISIEDKLSYLKNIGQIDVMLKQNYENLHNINLNQHEEIQIKNKGLIKNNSGKGKKDLILINNKEKKSKRSFRFIRRFTN